MSRGKVRFTQADVTRALRAALGAGLKVARLEIDVDGKITIFSVDGERQSAQQDWEDEYEAWSRGQKAQAAEKEQRSSAAHPRGRRR